MAVDVFHSFKSILAIQLDLELELMCEKLSFEARKLADRINQGFESSVSLVEFVQSIPFSWTLC